MDFLDNRTPFAPEASGLDKSFQLTNYADLKGWGCKVPQKVLTKLLAGLNDANYSVSEQGDKLSALIGIGLDSAVIPIRENLVLIQTTDFFYPLVDDPYVMGRIACANVLSDLYALGIYKCDNLLMLLGLSLKMKDEERDVIVPLMVEGFKDAAKDAETKVTGGDTTLNPWCTIGGVASAVCKMEDVVWPNKATPGDVLVLTKPLGTQVAVLCYSWLRDNSARWERAKEVITESEARNAFEIAVKMMCVLNKTGASLMSLFKAHGSTDVTGFGILGHAKNLVEFQEQRVSFIFNNIPVIAKVADIGKLFGGSLNILSGTSPETSGGLLIALDKNTAAYFCDEYYSKVGYRPWVVGEVVEGDRKVSFNPDLKVIEVTNIT